MHMSQSVFAGVGTGAAASRWVRVIAVLPRLLASSGLALLGLALSELPFTGAAPLPVLMAVLLVPSLLLTVLALGAKRLAGASWSRLGDAWTPRLLGGFVALAVFLVGSAFSNTLLVDAPTEPWTIAGYGISAAVALALFVAIQRRCSTPTSREMLARRWREILAAVCFAAGVGATAADACCFPQAFPSAHAVAILLALAAFAASAFVICHTNVIDGRTRRWLRSLGIVTLLTTLAGVSFATRHASLEPFLRGPSGGRALFLAVRGLGDRDGDGFSSWLGGGDCDDDDPLAYPLSTVGRDCLAILPGPGEPSPIAAGAATATATATGNETALSTAPKVVLLVTIDAFRCGFGLGERPELTDACPNLADLARNARFQPRAYARAPDTLGSLASLLAHRAGGKIETLPAALQKRGYRTAAIPTHGALLRIPRLRESFDRADEELAPLSQRSHTTTSEDVTDHLLSHVEDATRRDEPTFIWAHYYDPHTPYVQTPGSHWVWSRNDAYVEEVKRTDDAIGRLVSRLKQLVPNDALALFITADHGDELGEHGGSDHGRTLYDEVVRVPFLAWRSGPDPVAGLPSSLPGGGIDMTPYILSVVTGAPFEPSEAVLMKTKTPSDTLVGVVHGDFKYILHARLGYEELFDLRADPHEQHDLAGERRDEVEAMRHVLGDLLQREQHAPTTL